MRNLIIIMLLSIPLRLFTQEFAPVGAIWHYTQLPIDPEMTTYKSIESISNTVINGKQCKELIEVERYYSDTILSKYLYMYSENDSVFFYADNEFHLLYDFGAIAGDTIVLEYFWTANGTPLKMIIDSTGTIDINGENRGIQYITCGDGIVVEFGNHVIKDIGSTFYMFPTYDGTTDGPLRCYQDDFIGLYLSPYHPNYGWNHQDCDQIITYIPEKSNNRTVTIYPNPTRNGIISVDKIELPFKYRVLSLYGRLLKTGIISTSNDIPVNELHTGSYLLEIEEFNSKESKLIFQFIVLY